MFNSNNPYDNGNPLTSIYEEEGYLDRRDYLEFLASEFNLPYETVLGIAELLGESEDFDGLLNALEDAEEIFGSEEE